MNTRQNFRCMVMNGFNKSILYSVIAAVSLSAMAFFVRQASEKHGILVILFSRFFITSCYTLSVIFVARAKGKIFSLRTQRIPLHLFRAIAASLAMYLFFCSLSTIPVVTANVLNLTHPLFSILIAAFILKENTCWIEIIFCMLGFIGVICILQPSRESALDVYALYALLSGFFTSMSIVGVRELSKKEHPYSILLYNSLLSLLITIILLLITGIPQQIPDLYSLILVGLFGSLYQDLLIRALALSPAKFPSNMMYLSIASSYFIGLTVQNESINILAMIGIMLITSSGILLILKNKSQGNKKNV